MNRMLAKALGYVVMQGEPEAAGGSADTPKRKSIKTVDAALLKDGIYKATFNNGTVVECKLSDIPAEHKDAMLAQFLAYGLKQKLDDSMAGADESEAIEELQSTWDAITKGAWTSRVPGEGSEGGLFARAYAARHGIPLGDAKAKIGQLVQKNLEANRKKDPEITERAVLNKIREVALDRDADLKAQYEDLKAKKKAKKSAKQELEIDLRAE